MSNVLEFPKSAIVRDTAAQTAEKLNVLKERSTRNFADALVQEVCEEIQVGLDACGIDTQSDSFRKDFLFLASILSATIYRAMEIPHNMHNFIDDTVSVVFVDPNEEDPQGELALEEEAPPPSGSTS